VNARPFALAALLAGVALFAPLTTAASAADQTPYQINAVLSQTGPAAFLGANETKTLEILQQVVNRQGGIHGRPITFVVADDQSNPLLAVQLVTKLVAAGVPVIYGPGFVATCAATMSITMKTGPVMWCMAPGISPAPGSYVFSTQANGNDSTLVLVRYFRERGWKRLAVITSTDASGQSFDRGMQFALAQRENKDVQVVAYEHMNPTDINAAGVVERVKAANPQAILTLATGTPWGTMMRSISDAGLTVPIGGGNGNVVITQLKQYQSYLPAELYFAGNIAMAPHSIGPGPIADAQAVFFNAFAAAGIQPDISYNLGWDAGMIVVTALRALGPSATAQQLRDYILNLHGYAGILGIYDFRDGSQRGIGQDSLVIDRWDKTNSRFIAVSRRAGYLDAK
jgi:branched-chain amino acid transport system substrate-binding protein